MKTKLADLMSAVAVNRGQFYELLKQIETEAGTAIDIDRLEIFIDAAHLKRNTVTPTRARWILSRTRVPLLRRR